MKKFLFLVAVLFSMTALAQKKTFQEKTLQEIDSLIANPLEFLGKTDSAIIAAGRPASLVGGDEWKTDIIKASSRNSMDASKTIVIGTGCGSLMLVVAAKSGLVYTISFIPHTKAKLNGAEIMKHLSSKYQFDKSGSSVIQAKDATYIGLAVTTGVVMVVALKEDKNEVRFFK